MTWSLCKSTKCLSVLVQQWLSCFGHRYLKQALPHVYVHMCAHMMASQAPQLERSAWSKCQGITGSSLDLASTTVITPLGTLLGTTNWFWLQPAQKFKAARWLSVCAGIRESADHRGQQQGIRSLVHGWQGASGPAAAFLHSFTWACGIFQCAARRPLGQLLGMRLTSCVKCSTRSTPMYPIRVHSQQNPVPYYVAHLQ